MDIKTKHIAIGIVILVIGYQFRDKLKALFSKNQSAGENEDAGGGYGGGYGGGAMPVGASPTTPQIQTSYNPTHVPLTVDQIPANQPPLLVTQSIAPASINQLTYQGIQSTTSGSGNTTTAPTGGTVGSTSGTILNTGSANQ